VFETSFFGRFLFLFYILDMELITYHGSAHRFNKFSFSEASRVIGGGLGWSGWGMNFTTDISMATHYAQHDNSVSSMGYLYTVRLDIDPDHWFYIGKKLKDQPAFVKNVLGLFDTSRFSLNDSPSGMFESLDTSGGNGSKSTALKFVRNGVFGIWGELYQIVWDLSLVKILSVQEVPNLLRGLRTGWDPVPYNKQGGKAFIPCLLPDVDKFGRVVSPAPAPAQVPARNFMRAPVRAPAQTPVRAPAKTPVRAPARKKPSVPMFVDKKRPVKTPVKTPVSSPVSPNRIKKSGDDEGQLSLFDSYRRRFQRG
jgi:hypothetical protein